MHAPFLTVTVDAWRIDAGDPTIRGWLITAGYLLTAARCLLAVRARVPGPWWWIAAFAGSLGLNKQLDLQTLLIEWGRNLSRATGWYEHRRMVERVFLVASAVVFILALTWWVRRYRSFLRTHRLLVFGMLMVVLYTGLRAADALHGIAGAESPDGGWWLEAVEGSGVFLMLAGACCGRKSPSVSASP